MELRKNGSQPSARGPAEYFTGTVRIDQLFKAPAPSRSSGAYVTFEPGARSNWHTHPLGPTLIRTAGHCVVATGRDAAKVVAAVGKHENLLVIKLDVTRPQDAPAAVKAAVAKFGRIDILVNNAGNFFAGFFEELSPEQVRNQIETLLFGPMNVTRATLPVMRKQRSGLVVTVSSTAGIAGQMFCTAYAAAKFGIEGWMESLAPEIMPFGIRTMLVEPGFFRTELLTDASTIYAQPTIDDYAERTKEIVPAWKSMHGKQTGDPAKLADALVKLVALKEPPTRFAAGADAMQAFEAKAETLLAQADAHRELSRSLAVDDLYARSAK